MIHNTFLVVIPSVTWFTIRYIRNSPVYQICINSPYFARIVCEWYRLLLTAVSPLLFDVHSINIDCYVCQIPYTVILPMALLPDTQNCGWACAENAGNIFPATAGKRSRHASRHVRDARAVMHAGIANQRFHLKSVGGENVPVIPGACSTRNCTYLVRGPFRNTFCWSTVYEYLVPCYLVMWNPVMTRSHTTRSFADSADEKCTNQRRL